MGVRAIQYRDIGVRHCCCDRWYGCNRFCLTNSEKEFEGVDDWKTSSIEVVPLICSMSSGRWHASCCLTNTFTMLDLVRTSCVRRRTFTFSSSLLHHVWTRFDP